MKLLLATHNQGKVRDLKNLLADERFEILSLADFPNIPEVIEDGDTFLYNARKKALEIFQATGLPVLADDSGLVVDALDGRPGVYSARYAGEQATAEENNAKLLEELSGKESAEQRRARYIAVLVLKTTDGTEYVTEGRCEGYIAQAAKGDNGFGYDPLFIHPAFGGRTMGEITLEEKNSVSHRGEAMRKMQEKLKGLYP